MDQIRRERAFAWTGFVAVISHLRRYLRSLRFSETGKYKFLYVKLKNNYQRKFLSGRFAATAVFLSEACFFNFTLNFILNQ